MAVGDGADVVHVDGAASAHVGEHVAQGGEEVFEGAADDEWRVAVAEEEVAYVVVGCEVNDVCFYDLYEVPAILNEGQLGCGADGVASHHTTRIFLCGLHHFFVYQKKSCGE